jgi:hypothetical protein
MATIPDSMIIYGVKKTDEGDEILRAPLSPGSTVMDYALFYIPGSWPQIKPVFTINGVHETDFARILKPGDKLSFDIDSNKENNYIKVEWLDAANNYPDAVNIIAPKLKEKMMSLPKAEYENTVKRIRHRGWTIIEGKLIKMGVKLDNIGLKYGAEAFPNPSMNPRDFAYEVGLGNIDQEQIQNVVDYIKERWNNFTVLRVRIPKNADTYGMSLPIDQILTDHGINKVAFQSTSKWGDTATIVYRLDKSDSGYSELAKVVAEIENELGYDTLLFMTEDSHEKWQQMHPADNE